LPEPAAALLADQLDIELGSLHADRLDVGPGARGRHLARAMAISGFREFGPVDAAALQAWLEDRALGHDGPLALLRTTVDRLRRQALVRPGLTVLERLVAGARAAAELEVARRLQPVLTGGRGLPAALDRLLVVADGQASATVRQLGQETRTLARVAEPIAKLQLLHGLGAERWDLSAVPANRLRMLAQYVDHASSQAIGRRDESFRHPALLAFCAEASARVTDELVDLLDDGIANQHASARRALVREKLEVSDRANASVVLLGELLEVLLDPDVPDPQVRQAVWKRASPEELQQALELAASIKRPLQDSHVEKLGDRYRAARDFAQRILATLTFRATADGRELLEAVELLRELNRRGVRRVPDTAPTGFVPRGWRPFVRPPGGGIDRHHWELCVLSELRDALRAGEIWVKDSRRYSDPERFLIPAGDWTAAREKLTVELQLPATADERLATLLEHTDVSREVLDADLKGGETDIAVDAEGSLSVKRLRAAPREPAVDDLAREVSNELAVIDLPDLLIELDRRCNFTGHLTHAGGAKPRRQDHARHLFAAIIAQACNLRDRTHGAR